MIATNDTAMPRRANVATDLVFLGHGPKAGVGI